MQAQIFFAGAMRGQWSYALGKNSQLTKLEYFQRFSPPTTMFSPAMQPPLAFFQTLSAASCFGPGFSNSSDAPKVRSSKACKHGDAGRNPVPSRAFVRTPRQASEVVKSPSASLLASLKPTANLAHLAVEYKSDPAGLDLPTHVGAAAHSVKCDSWGLCEEKDAQHCDQGS